MMDWGRTKSGLLVPRSKQRGMFAMGPGFFNGATRTGDPNVKALLHFDGANGSTVITDATGKSTWVRYSPAALTTSQKKFGASSLNVNGGYVYSTNVGLQPSGNFCVEGFAYSTNSGTRGLFAKNPASAADALALGWDGSSTWEVYAPAGVQFFPATLPTGWFHFAVYRVSGQVYLAINGTVLGHFADSTDLGTYGSMYFGVYFSGAFPWQGYMDECRVTYGSSPYGASNFTPPTAAFPWP